MEKRKRRAKTLNYFKKHIIENWEPNKKHIYNCYSEYVYKNDATLKVVRWLRNRPKLVKFYINEESIWYVLLDKLNRNVHIYWEVKDLKTNY